MYPVVSLWGHIDGVFLDCTRSREDLHDYQLEAIEFLYNNPYSALFIDVGLGKTISVLTLLDRLIWEDGYDGKILIVAPIRVATRVWPQEIRKWTHIAAGVSATVLRIVDDDPRLKLVPQKKRTAEKWRLWRELLNSKSQVHIINQEAVAALVAECQKRKTWPYKILVFDESSRLRDHNSVVFKALKKVRPFVTRFIQLTATPASQHYGHLFSQIYLLDGGERFGTHITPFRERYFSHNQWSHTWTLREGAAEEIERLIADICLVQRREKNFQISVRQIRLSNELMRDYQEFERELVLELPDDVTIDAINSAVLSNKLLQYASGAVYDENKIAHVIHDEKIEELKSLIEETLDEPVMCAYWYKSSLARLRKAFPDAAVMDREGKVEGSWNKRQHKVMFVHPRSASHGLNLQAGGHHVAIFDIFWPLELFTQLIGRLDRQGQKSTVMVHLLSSCGTMDETVSANLQLLRSAEDSMFRRLQALRR